MDIDLSVINIYNGYKVYQHAQYSGDIHTGALYAWMTTPDTV